MEKLESNKLIAEFMGATPCIINIKSIGDVAGCECDEFKLPLDEIEYHKSWDWLMPVVEKIESLKGVHFVISELGCDIYHFGYKVSDTREETKILTIYKAVIEFIKWYNESKALTNS